MLQVQTKETQAFSVGAEGGPLGRALGDAGDGRFCQLDQVHQLSVGDRLTIDADAFAIVDQMGRGIEPHPMAGCLEAAGREGADRSLAFGAGDMHDGVAEMGIAKLAHQCPHAIQVEIRPGEFR